MQSGRVSFTISECTEMVCIEQRVRIGSSPLVTDAVSKKPFVPTSGLFSVMVDAEGRGRWSIWLWPEGMEVQGSRHFTGDVFDGVAKTPWNTIYACPDWLLEPMSELVEQACVDAKNLESARLSAEKKD